MEVVDFVSLIFHSDTFSHWKFFLRKSSYAISRQMENSFIGEGFYLREFIRSFTIIERCSGKRKLYLTFTEF